MKLEELLESNPKLVNHLKECKNKQEIEKAVRNVVSKETADLLEVSELKMISNDDLDEVSGGRVVNMLSDSGIGGISGWILCQSLINAIYKVKDEI